MHRSRESMINSVEAYRSIPDLQARQERVLRAIRDNPGLSRNEIARIAGMMPSNVSSRISELIREGSVVPAGRKRDPITGRAVTTYVHNPEVERCRSTTSR